MTLHDGSRLISLGSQSISRDASALLSATNETVRAIGASFAKHLRRSRQIQELYRFSDRELRDVGLCRSDIPAIQKGHYRRE